MLERLSSKRATTILTSVTAVLFLLYFIISHFVSNNFSLSDYTSILSSIDSYVFLYVAFIYLALVLSLITALLSGYHFFKRNSRDYILLGQFIINVGIAIFSIFMVPGANSLMALYSGITRNTILTMSQNSLYKHIMNVISMYNYLGYINIITLILVVYTVISWLFALKIIHIKGIDFDFDEDIEENFKNKETARNENYHFAGEDEFENSSSFEFDSQKAKNIARQSSQSAKKTMRQVQQGATRFFSSWYSKALLGVIALLLVVFIGFRVYNAFFSYQTIYLLDDSTIVTFSGYDGDGYIDSLTPGDIDYDKNDANIADFISSINYDYSASRDLSNGDVITISAVYDKTRAKELKLKIKNDNLEKEVSGLTVVYSKSSEVPSAIANRILDECDEKASNEFTQTNYHTYSYDFDSIYFASGQDRENYIIALYYITDNYQSWMDDSDVSTSNYYVYYSISNVNSLYLEEDNYYISSRTLTDSEGEDVTDSKNIMDALKQTFSSYEIEEF